MNEATALAIPPIEPVFVPFRLDIGCGINKQPGFTGIDSLAFLDFPIEKRPDIVWDLRTIPWQNNGKPIEDNSVDEVHCSHFIEHLTNFDDKWERVNFFNELYRVMKKGAKCQLIFPHWNSQRYYGDPTHKEPFSEMGFSYLLKEWRTTQAPHTLSVYTCDFQVTWGYGLRQDLAVKNPEYQMYAMQNYKEVLTDIIATLVKL